MPGASATEAHGINNAGVIVGTADNYGFVNFDDGSKLGLLGLGAITDPMAINNAFTIAGSYYDGTHWHGFIDAGEIKFINAPGATDTWVTGINDAGTLVGYSDTGPDTPTQDFIATPLGEFETFVRELYQAAFGRDADADGLSFWVNQLNTGLADRLQGGTGGLTPKDFIQDLAGSAEFHSLHDQQSDAQYVDSLYVNALGRHAEPAGQAGWAGVLQSGASRVDVLWAISQSPEGQQHFAMS